MDDPEIESDETAEEEGKGEEKEEKEKGERMGETCLRILLMFDG